MSKTVYCITCSMIFKIIFPPNSPIFRIRQAEKEQQQQQKTSTQATAKRYAFHANTIIY